MRTTFALLTAVLTFAFAAAASEREIIFPKELLPVHEIMRRIEKQTGVRISMPFSDDAKRWTAMPERSSMSEALHWISRYYETYNSVKLRFTEKDGVVSFQKASSLDDGAQKELLGRKLSLRGKNLSIAESLELASVQLRMPIELCVADQAGMHADYDYDCTVAEFLNEVASYFRSYNRTHLSYAVKDDRIELYFNGRVKVQPLVVEMLSVKDLTVPMELDVLPPAARSAPAKSAPAKEVSYGEEGEEGRKFKAALDSALALSIEPFLDKDKAYGLFTFLVRPSENESRAIELLNSVTGSLRRQKGFDAWREKILALDGFEVSLYSRKKAVAGLRESWSRQVLHYLRGKNRIEGRTERLGGRLHAEALAGRNLCLRGKRASRPAEDGVGSSVNAGCSLEYGKKCGELWRWRAEAGLERGFSLHGHEELEFGSVELKFMASRTLDAPELRAVSPYAVIVFENGILGAGELQDHRLLLGGLKAHWTGRRPFFGFDAMIADSDFYAGSNWPEGREERSFFTGAGRDSSLLGMRHRMAIMMENGPVSFGPVLGAALDKRSSDSYPEDAVVTTIEAGYRGCRSGRWGAGIVGSSSWWKGDMSRRVGRIETELSHEPFGRGERLLLKGLWENGRGGTTVEDYSARGVSAGVEMSW